MTTIHIRKDLKGGLRASMSGTVRPGDAASGSGDAEENGLRRSSSGKNTLSLLSAFLLGLLLALSAGRAQAISLYDGLVAYWPFSGNALDVTGNGHDGLVNGAALATDRFGNPNSAYDFSGGDYIDVASDSQLQITGPLTLNAWINYRSLPSNPRVISFGPDHTGYELLVGGGAFGTTPNQPLFFFGNSGVASSTLLTPNVWHMLTAVGTPGASGGLQLWVDGILAGDTTGGPTAFSYPGSLNIGRKASASFDPWDGLIDDAMIYNRALTAAEIQSLFNLNETLPPPPISAVPEPSALLLLASGLIVLGTMKLARRRVGLGRAAALDRGAVVG